MTYPLPRSLIDRLRGLETLYVVQELDGFLSKHVLMLAKANDLPVRIRPVGGRFVSAGALSMDALLRGLAEAFGVAYTPPASGQPIPIPERPGTFCPGCPHRGILYTIKRLCGADDVYGGDIGCSSLPPYYSDWLTCMGSGLGIAHGVATLKGGSGRVYASMGDSTFFHCGMPQVLNAVQQNTPITIFILDNQWTAMTGHQPLPTTPSYAREPVSIAAVVKALGARQVWEVDAYDLRAFRETLKETRAAAGVRVVVVKGPCRLQDQRAARQAGRELPARAVIVDELCHQCAECFEALGCPAIVYEDDTYRIDEALCGRCGICAQMCPNSSVSRAEFGEGAAP
jgi:indolepyruvate ferredoxin oxidoreductase alpha subunit